MMPGDPVVGSTVLRRPAIQSPNFVTTVSGWTINADGSAEFNNLLIRGTFNGTDFVINSAGAFFYSGPPAAGNLIASVTNGAGTDSFGNNYLGTTATYDNSSGIATALAAGFVAFYSGSLAGGWSALSSVAGDVAGNLQVNAGGQLQLIGSGGVTVNGSSSTQTGSNGGVTSGPSGTVNAFPAAGPNHTHAETHTHPL